MKFNQAKRLLSTDINQLNENKLYKFKAELVTLFYLLRGDHGKKALFDGGFLIPALDSSAVGFVPRDKFMFTNLIRLMDEVERRIKKSG